MSWLLLPSSFLDSTLNHHGAKLQTGKVKGYVTEFLLRLTRKEGKLVMPCSSKWWLFLFVGIVQGRCPMKKQVFQGVDSIKIFIQQEKRWRKWPDDFRQAKRDHPPKKKWPKRNPTKNPTFTRTKHQTAPGNRTGSHCCSRNLLTSIINPPHPPRDARFFDWNPSTFHPKTRNKYLDPPKKYDPCEAAFDWRQRFRFSLHDLVVQFPDSKACKSMSNPHILHLFPNFLGKRVD